MADAVEAPPLTWANPSEHRRQIAQALRSSLTGKRNNVGSVTLAISTTTTCNSVSIKENPPLVASTIRAPDICGSH